MWTGCGLNLRAPVALYRGARKLLLSAGAEHGNALVINTASMAAKRPEAGLGAYAATKAGVIAFTESMNRELAGSGVKCVCRLPIARRDPDDRLRAARALPAGEMIQPADVAAMVKPLLYLSPAALVPELVLDRPGNLVGWRRAPTTRAVGRRSRTSSSPPPSTSARRRSTTGSAPAFRSSSAARGRLHLGPRRPPPLRHAPQRRHLQPRSPQPGGHRGDDRRRPSDFDIGNHHFPSIARSELAQTFDRLTPAALTYSAFLASGGEANDLAIKSARNATGGGRSITFDARLSRSDRASPPAPAIDPGAASSTPTARMSS